VKAKTCQFISVHFYVIYRGPKVACQNFAQTSENCGEYRLPLCSSTCDKILILQIS